LPFLISATLSGEARGQHRFGTVSAEESDPLLVRFEQILLTHYGVTNPCRPKG
jgi:hypothetical protein